MLTMSLRLIYRAKQGKVSLFVWHNSDTRQLKVLYRHTQITLKYMKIEFKKTLKVALKRGEIKYIAAPPRSPSGEPPTGPRRWWRRMGEGVRRAKVVSHIRETKYV